MQIIVYNPVVQDNILYYVLNFITKLVIFFIKMFRIVLIKIDFKK